MPSRSQVPQERQHCEDTARGTPNHADTLDLNFQPLDLRARNLSINHSVWDFGLAAEKD